jgi:hypothetical protein
MDIKKYIIKRLDGKSLDDFLPKDISLKIIIQCSECGVERQSNAYYVLKHNSTLCRKCRKELGLKSLYNNEYKKRKEYFCEYYVKNSGRIKIRTKKYQKENPDIYRKATLKYNKNNPEKIKEIKLKYRNKEGYKDKVKVWDKKYYENNKISRCISNMIRYSINNNKNNMHWEELVDFTLDDLKFHLEKQFDEKMNWDNYGKGGWEIDHIRPISSFNINSYEDENFKKCWSLYNLQPLWGTDNRMKSNKYTEEVLTST